MSDAPLLSLKVAVKVWAKPEPCAGDKAAAVITPVGLPGTRHTPRGCQPEFANPAPPHTQADYRQTMPGMSFAASASRWFHFRRGNQSGAALAVSDYGGVTQDNGTCKRTGCICRIVYQQKRGSGHDICHVTGMSSIQETANKHVHNIQILPSIRMRKCVSEGQPLPLPEAAPRRLVAGCR